MNTLNLEQLSAWTPLADLDVAAVRVVDCLYFVGDGLYLLGIDTNELLEPDPRAPLVTMAYWAPSVGAARRAALNDLSADDGAVGQVPAAFAAGAEVLSYDQILTYARARGVKPFERATYSAPSGAFVHKTIEVGRVCFNFRSPESIAEERPYSVMLRLP